MTSLITEANVPDVNITKSSTHATIFNPLMSNICGSQQGYIACGIAAALPY